MQIKSCSIHRDVVIAYTDFTCPLCEAEKTIAAIEIEIEKLKDEILESKNETKRTEETAGRAS